MKHRPPLVDIVCHDCQAVLAREEREDGERRDRAERRPPDAEPRPWTIKVLAEIDGEWRISTDWPPEHWVCWQCKADGFVDAFDLAFAQGHGRVRIPTRPFL